ncbi:glycoside hydrolase family 27 protein [Lentinula raphanica]|nr:glycoside hydrolase family 27 protein [Lentinula raphanica]
MTFLTLSFAALLAYLSLPSKPLTTAALHDGVRKHPSLHNGVGKLPFMGYNTWNAYHCDIDEDLILTTANLMKSLGLAELGYQHMNIDDCWAEKNRSASGDLVANATRIYESAPIFVIFRNSFLSSCPKQQDSLLCSSLYANGEENNHGFGQESSGKLGERPMTLTPIGNILLASSTRIRSSPGLPISMDTMIWTSVMNPDSFYPFYLTYIGHSHRGNGNLTFDEAKSHFTAWSLMKSPLLIGTDLTVVTNETLEVLMNPEIIAINQDHVVGTSISPFRWGINPDWTFNATHPAQYWSGESQNGTIFMLLNVLDEPADMFFNLTESPWINAGRQYSVRDLWTHTDNGTAVRNFTAEAVPAHGVVALLMKDAGPEPAGTQPPCARPEWCIDQNGTLVQ